MGPTATWRCGTEIENPFRVETMTMAKCSKPDREVSPTLDIQLFLVSPLT
jgi:hypothetical protein